MYHHHRRKRNSPEALKVSCISPGYCLAWMARRTRGGRGMLVCILEDRSGRQCRAPRRPSRGPVRHHCFRRIRPRGLGERVRSGLLQGINGDIAIPYAVSVFTEEPMMDRIGYRPRRQHLCLRGRALSMAYRPVALGGPNGTLICGIGGMTI